MNNYYLHIQPLDTLFFRSGKPFSKGEESWVDSSMLIPYPSVVLGAIFTSLWAQKKVSPYTQTDIDSLSVTQIYLYNAELNKVLIPAPLDLFVTEKSLHFFAEEYIDKSISNYPLSTLIKPKTNDLKTERKEGLFISYDDLKGSYLNRHNHRTTIYSPDDFSVKNPKIGIELSFDSHTTIDGQLYKTEMIDLADGWGYLVEYQSIHKLESGILKLGGEGKLASYQNIEKKPEILQSSSVYEEGRKFFKIYIQSPTFWASGDGILELNSLEDYRLISASVGKYLSIGGFNVKENKPKPMRKAVPAGSIYLMSQKNMGTNFMDIFEKLISSNPANTNGFGRFQIVPLNT